MKKLLHLVISSIICWEGEHMTTTALLITTFITLYILNYLIDFGLTHLNINYMLKFKSPPDLFQKYIAEERYKQTIDYTTTKAKFDMLTTTITCAIFLIFIYSGFMNSIDSKLYGLISNEILRGICFFSILFFLSFLMGIPFSLYSTFVIEEKFGFNRETPKIWIVDQIKSIIISLLLMIPLGFLILYFMAHAGEYWWLYVWILFFFYSLFLALIYPIAIAPVFNKFNPLEEGELKTKLENLAKKAEFPIKNIFIIDAAKRSTHSNAYFAGLGHTKRLVLYDTMIKDFTTDEIVGVVAHEIGHSKKKHILKHMVLTQITALIFFYCLNLGLHNDYLYKTFFVDHKSTYMGLILLSFISSLIISFFSPLFNLFSWKFESEADRYAYEISTNKDAIKTMLIKLAEKNLSNLTPHPLYARIYYSHPPILKRIKDLN